MLLKNEIPDVEKREPSCIVGGNVNWCIQYGKHYWRFLKKLKIELPHGPTVPLLGIYIKETKTLIRKDMCTSIFIAALFIIAKVWNQPVSISIWMNKDVYIQRNITQP